MARFANYRQRQVLKLEPSRGARAVGELLVFCFTAALATIAVLYARDAAPESIQLPEPNPFERAHFVIGAAVLAAIALLALAAAWYDLGRWRLSRMVMKASNAPLFRDATPSHETALADDRATNPPPLEVAFVTPRSCPKPPKPLRRVTADSNVIGRRPLDVAYLRMFDNQPRARTFLESAWREFGYVHMLRAVTSVTRREFDQVRRANSLDAMFIHDDASFEAALGTAPRTPLARGRLALPNVAPTRVTVRDRYGSYPIRAALCHGQYWRRAVDLLIGRMDLVVLDLSGFTERNEGTAYELQRVIDRVPIERVVMLRDQRSSKRFLDEVIRRSWLQMSATSPNAVGGTRTAVVAVTDQYRRRQSQQGNQTVENTILVSNRRSSRRVATAAQFRIDELGSTSGAPSRSQA